MARMDRKSEKWICPFITICKINISFCIYTKLETLWGFNYFKNIIFKVESGF